MVNGLIKILIIDFIIMLDTPSIPQLFLLSNLSAIFLISFSSTVVKLKFSSRLSDKKGLKFLSQGTFISCYIN